MCYKMKSDAKLYKPKTIAWKWVIFEYSTVDVIEFSNYPFEELFSLDFVENSTGYLLKKHSSQSIENWERYS